MVHFTYFRPFHEYTSYYPYYLPSYYSRFYPKHYNRYYEPTNYWLEKRQPVLQKPIVNQVAGYSPQQKYIDNKLLLVYALLLFVIMFGKKLFGKKLL